MYSNPTSSFYGTSPIDLRGPQGNTGDEGSQGPAGPVGPQGPVVISVQSYDATGDILAARTVAGYTNDAPALNAALAAHKSVHWRPDVGGLLVAETIVPQRGGTLSAFGQATPIMRSLSFGGDTLRCGTASGAQPAGDVTLNNLWFVHPGRQTGYSAGPLANRLTNGASHVAIYRGQHVTLRNIGGYGMPHGISLFNCGGATIDSPFFYGGVWNPLDPNAQEGISQIRLAGSELGHSVNVEIIAPQCYGANSLGIQPRTIGTNTVRTKLDAGPRYGLLVESGECIAVRGGFFGLFAEAAVCSRAATDSDVLMRLLLDGVWIDESNDALVRTLRTADSRPMLDGLEVRGGGLNGQLSSRVGFDFQASPGGLPSVRRVRTNTQVRAVLASGATALGVDGWDFSGTEFVGYNMANNEDPSLSSGIYADKGANYVHGVGGVFGGGINEYSETNAVNVGNGLTPNGCKYGLFGFGCTNSTYAMLTDRNRAKPGGAMVSGSFTPMPTA